MPWKESCILDQRLQFLSSYQKDEMSVADLCRAYGISRPTAYRWINRYNEIGPEGLVDRSRRPHTCSHATLEPMENAILVLRAKHPSWGARKLKARLEMLQPELVWPAASTFGNILSRAGLTSPQKKRKRITRCSEPFSTVTGPNQLWCMDFKGYFVTGDGKRCDPFTITDAYSRYLIRCQIVSRIDLSQVRAICEAAMREYGMPARIRTDNGAPFAGLQTSYTQQIAGLTLRGNYTLSHCLDEVSNGGLLSFSSQGILSPLPGELSRSYGSCDYDVRYNISAFGLYQTPFHSNHALLRQMFGGWAFSETAFFHTGLPFTILSQPYAANGNGVFQSSGPQLARRVPGVPLYRKSAVSGVTVAGTRQWVNPDAFVSAVDPSTGACTGGDSVANCQFGDSGRNTVRGPHFTDSDIYITKTLKLHEGITFRFDTQMFNAFNHANFALPSNVQAGVPGSLIPARFGTLQSTISPPTGLLGVGLGGDSSPRMIAFQGRIEF